MTFGRDKLIVYMGDRRQEAGRLASDSSRGSVMNIRPGIKQWYATLRRVCSVVYMLHLSMGVAARRPSSAFPLGDFSAIFLGAQG